MTKWYHISLCEAVYLVILALISWWVIGGITDGWQWVPSILSWTVGILGYKAGKALLVHWRGR